MQDIICQLKQLKFKVKNNIKIINWPPYYSNLNPIENGCDIMKINFLENFYNYK